MFSMFPVIGQTCRLAAALFAVLCLAGTPAIAASAATAAPPTASTGESIDADVSTRDIPIGDNFTGTRVIVFGTIEHSGQAVPKEAIYDVAIVIEGPLEELTARHKSDVAGLWVNTGAFNFRDVPGYYWVLSNRPMSQVASKAELLQLGIGVDNLRLVPSETVEFKEADEYRAAILRVKAQEGLYREDTEGVKFIGKSLFRGSVALPANAPVGEFSAKIYLFKNGQLAGTPFATKLDLRREGFERAVYNFAMGFPLWYGLLSVGVALTAGFLATILFRRN